MIKFFRHIRQRMIKENRVSKYLLYALGEIILVVIGILIALQINNWNEARKDQQTELKYLQQLHEDLRADSVFFDSRLRGIEEQIITLEKLKLLCNGTLGMEEQSKILDRIQNPFTRFAMQSKVINDELDLKAVTDDHIRDMLRQYRSKYEYVVHTGSAHNDMARDNYMTMAKLSPTLLEHDPDSNTLADYASFCDYPNIEGIIGLQARLISLFSANTKTFTELNAQLSARIERYIEENS